MRRRRRSALGSVASLKLATRAGGRRATLALMAAAAGTPLLLPATWSRAAARPARVGVLSFGAPLRSQRPDPEAAFFQALPELGYVDGQNLMLERRFALDRPDALPPLAVELVQDGVDVIATAGPAPVAAVTAATRSIPVVAVSGSDPVADGWAQMGAACSSNC